MGGKMACKTARAILKNFSENIDQGLLEMTNSESQQFGMLLNLRLGCC